MISEFCEIVIQMLQFYLPTERILVDLSLEIANLGCLIIYKEMTHRSVLCIRYQLVKN